MSERLACGSGGDEASRARAEPAVARSPTPRAASAAAATVAAASADAASVAAANVDTARTEGIRLAELSELDPHALALLATLGC
jgi:hypothetical protein